MPVASIIQSTSNLIQLLKPHYQTLMTTPEKEKKTLNEHRVLLLKTPFFLTAA